MDDLISVGLLINPDDIAVPSPMTTSPYRSFARTVEEASDEHSDTDDEEVEEEEDTKVPSTPHPATPSWSSHTGKYF
jgi:hypothetical protein